jgi:DNA-binding transcriptional LysR family regulator
MTTGRQLEIFVAVALDGGFRRAADRLGISEASVSKQMAALERSCGGQLFARKPGSAAQLSELGVQILETAKSALRLQTHITRAAHRPPQPDCPELLIRHYLLEHSIRPNLARLIEAGLPPDTRFTVLDDAVEMAARVRASSNVYALYRGDTPSDSGVDSVLLTPATLSIYSSPEIAADIRSGARSMQSVPFMLPRSSPNIRDFAMRKLFETEFLPEKFIEGSQFVENWTETIIAGEAIAIFFDGHVEDLVRRKLIEPIPPKITSSWLVLAANRRADRKLLLSIVNACRLVLDASGFD